MSGAEIGLSREVISHFGLEQIPEKLVVRAGQKEVLASVRLLTSPSKGYSLSSELKQLLCLKNKTHLYMKYDRDNEKLCIGPFVGLLTLAIPFKSGGYARTSFSAELIFLAKISQKLRGCFFLFRPSDVSWEAKTVRGYQYTASGSWRADIFPLPDVIYDRIPSRRLETSEKMKNFRNQVNQQGTIQYFNSSYLNKWSVYQKLVQYPELQPYLPETRILNAENLTALLEKYKILFAKPANGSLGRGIIKIQRMPQGRLAYTLYRGGKINGQAQSVEEFLWKTKKARRGWNYIIQQGIPLQVYQNSHFDIRIIFQKNGENRWKISKKFFRVARQGSSISNLSSGGHVEPYKRLSRKLFHGNREKIAHLNREIRRLCTMAAEKLEEEGCFGELGLDLGLSRDGRLWLIEINSKPRKTTETNMSMAIVTNTFRRPLEYAVFLAGFSPQAVP